MLAFDLTQSVHYFAPPPIYLFRVEQLELEVSSGPRDVVFTSLVLQQQHQELPELQ